MKLKTVYALRIRFSDDDEWSAPSYYLSRKARDHDEKFNRCLGGIRTHSFEEKKTSEELEELFL